MAAGSFTHALNALLTFYEISYPDKTQRLQALKADYLRAYSASKDSLGKTLSGSSADGINATWAVSLSTEQRLSVMATAIKRLEGKASSVVRLYARDGNPALEPVV